MQTELDEWELDADWLPLPFEEHWLPRRPLAGKTKHGGYYRMSRERALKLPYIESNPLALKSLVITDHDGGMADEIVAHAGLPQPSYVALNPITRSGQIVYALETPVILTDAARRGPVNLLARIEAGLNDVLAGDVAYGGRTTKNPTHVEHLTLWGPEHAVYKLKDLADPLDRLKALPKFKTTTERRKKLRTSGTGRNVDLFDLTRKWSYRRRGDYDQLTSWLQVVQDYAWDRNVELIGPAFTNGPLLAGEVNQLGRSVATWTWRHIHHTFSEIQTIRGRKGGQATTAKLTADELTERSRKGGRITTAKLTAGELAERGRKGGQVSSEAKREANRVRATKYDMGAIVAAALEEA
ncbi:replication initiation protein [Nocardia tenerifensis]|nr:replication initiation protein [Nocardia tenerifensis]